MIKGQQILKENRICHAQGNIVSDMDGEKVMLSIDNGKYYNLGEMGGEIWERINESHSVQGLITSLIKQYDVEEKECEAQVLSFLELLLDEGLIVIKS